MSRSRLCLAPISPRSRLVRPSGDEEDLEEYEAAFGIAAAAEGRLEPTAEEKAMLAKLAKEEADRAAEEEEGEEEDEEEDEEEEEEGDDDDEEEDEDTSGGRRRGGRETAEHGGAAMGATSSSRLWRSREARQRWLGLMRAPTAPLHAIALGLHALEQHAAAFAPLQLKNPGKSKALELDHALACWYHAGAFGSAPKGGASKAKGSGKGGKSVAFSAQEIKWLREGNRMFAADDTTGRGVNNWYRRTLDKFPFHPSRTHASLQQKWNAMRK